MKKPWLKGGDFFKNLRKNCFSLGLFLLLCCFYCEGDFSVIK